MALPLADPSYVLRTYQVLANNSSFIKLYGNKIFKVLWKGYFLIQHQQCRLQTVYRTNKLDNVGNMVVICKRSIHLVCLTYVPNDKIAKTYWEGAAWLRAGLARRAFNLAVTLFWPCHCFVSQTKRVPVSILKIW